MTADAEGRSRWEVARLVLIGVLVACAWLGIYVLFTHAYPDSTAAGTAYRYRDDALVTLSHARGLADVGTVSVSVSGSRVEGYSAPLQFALASAFYRLGGHGYRGFLDAQVAVSTMILGASVFALLRAAAPRRRMSTTALVATVVAVPLFATYAFFGWHSSGMENAMTNALAAAAVAALALAVRREWMLPVAGVVVALFALSRVEFAFHAVPLLVVTGVVLVARGAPETRWWRIGLLAVPAVGIWVAVLAVRLWYFGNLFPNTAVAQGISPGDNLRTWAGVVWPMLLPVAYAGFLAARRRSLDAGALVRSLGFWLATGGGLAGAAFLGWRAHSDGNLPGIDELVDASRVLGLWWWLALAAGLALLVRRFGLVEALLATLVATGACHLLVFGPARLAPERVVTFVLVPLACLAAALALRIGPPRIVVEAGTPTALTAARFTAVAVLVAGAVGGAWAAHRTWASQEVLCCDVSQDTGRVLARATSLEQRAGLPAVSVADADLGLLSFQKKVDVTDLGWLGDPLLARVWRRGEQSGRTDVAVDYLNHYASPDVVELHGVWSCTYAPWWRSAEFRGAYTKVRDDGWTASWGRTGCPGIPALEGGIWVRSDLLAGGANREVALSRNLAAHPDPAIVRRQLATCRSSVAWSCQYVTRSVYRNLRAFDDAGRLGEVVAAFRVSPSAPYDQGLLSSRGRGDWYRAAADSLFAPRTDRGGA